MKYILLALMLTGCAMLPQTYDAVLYDHYVWATVLVQHSEAACDKPETVIHDIQGAVTILDGTVLYDKYRNEPKLLAATNIVITDLTQLLTAYSKTPAPSVGYCHLKLQIATSSLEHVLEAVGGKPQ
jgi:hypothetical protein